jgi:hypothetical protein
LAGKATLDFYKIEAATMERFNFRTFVDTFNFDQLEQFVMGLDWRVVLHNRAVLAVGLIFILLFTFQKTRGLAVLSLTWGTVTVVYGICGIALKNSVITQPGPFVLAMTLSIAGVGYFVWVGLLKR